MIYGLIGKSLPHSISPRLHSLLGNKAYKIFEMTEGEVEDFLRSPMLGGCNVTIPYKTAAFALCDELSKTALEIGSVNTVINRDGRLYGYNTDAEGFLYMLSRAKISVCGKKVLVLGSGGTSKTAVYCLTKSGADVTVISRSGENNYDNITNFKNCDIIVNTTPVGMFPKTDEKPVDLTLFPKLEAVVDVIYNPLRTALLRDAQSLGLKSTNGLPMLARQGIRSHELFFDIKTEDGKTDALITKLRSGLGNIVLCGMPGCGKTVTAKKISELSDFAFADTDGEIEKRLNMPVPQIFSRFGESFFREKETEAASLLSSTHGSVIALGGGTVMSEKAMRALSENGLIFYIKRDLSLLATDGRPLSKNLEALYENRSPLYEKYADFTVDGNGTTAETAKQILDIFYENTCN